MEGQAVLKKYSGTYGKIFRYLAFQYTFLGLYPTNLSGIEPGIEVSGNAQEIEIWLQLATIARILSATIRTISAGTCNNQFWQEFVLTIPSQAFVVS